MKKAEIWNARLGDTKGSEQKGYRPVLIVSGDLLNTYAPVIWVCPLTTKIKDYHGDLILKPNKKNGLKEKSEVLAMHMRSISRDRLVNKIGKISTSKLEELRGSLNEILNMD
ncbi:MAG: transcription elongation factor GreAB [Flavobacteriales bacterium]|nr:transcription elongation factor GreAB [Flavobacteriales bacterium]|tara:strand:+ start:217 stop:552 length:336 start_codon:yes stop_codon:yes gene_type:complete